MVRKETRGIESEASKSSGSRPVISRLQRSELSQGKEASPENECLGCSGCISNCFRDCVLIPFVPHLLSLFLLSSSLAYSFIQSAVMNKVPTVCQANSQALDMHEHHVSSTL